MTDGGNIESSMPQRSADEPAAPDPHARGVVGGLSRRELLVAAAGLALAGCTQAGARTTSQATATPHRLTGPLSLLVDATVPSSVAAAVTQQLSTVSNVPGVHQVPTLAEHPDAVLTFGTL